MLVSARISFSVTTRAAASASFVSSQMQRMLFPAQLFGGSPTPLAGNELVTVRDRRLPGLGLRRGMGTNQDWGAQPARPKRFNQLLLLRVVKSSAVLVRRWLDRG